MKKKKNTESYHHGNLREAVLEHSIVELEKKGAFALSLRDIAQDLSVSHTAPYKHFPKKIDLLAAIVSKGFFELGLGMKRAWEFSSDPLEKLKKAGEEYILLLLSHPRRTELMFGGEIESQMSTLENKEELQENSKLAYMGMYKIVEEGQKSKLLNSEIATQTLMMMYWSLVHGFAVLNEFRWKSCKTEEEKSAFRKEMNDILELLIEKTKA
ncbi:MAG: TetR/AcrR family transcriptional regulator [Leptospira sp.]|jgi:AcrR family transcriptional regulator|nr:TetR/AcrR family transcriptional regulator [Leptospira sp.]